MADAAGGTAQHRPRLRWRVDGYALLAVPALVLVVAMVVVPISRVVVESASVGLEVYRAVVSSGDFRSSVAATLQISGITMVVCLILGYPVAYYLTQTTRRAAVVLAALLVGFWISILVRTYAWTVILGRTGPINDALMAIGLVNEPVDLVFNRLGVIVGMTQYLLPFMILTLYAGMNGIDRRLVAAARTLGAARSRAFVSVFLPLSVPGMFAGCTMVFVLATGFYVTPALLGGPRDATLAVYIERQLFYLEFGRAGAAAVLMLLFVSLIFLVADRLVGLDKVFAAARGR